MHTSRLKSHKSERLAYFALGLALVGHAPPAAAGDIRVRIERAAAVLNTLADFSVHDARAKEIAGADCVAVFPRFYKGAAVAGEVFETDLLREMSFGRGFISCRNGENWSAPGAVTLEAGSLNAQIGERVDIVILSLDKRRRPDLLANPFTFGSDGSAAGRSERILAFSPKKRVFTSLDLAGAKLKQDDSVNQALYGKPTNGREIVERGTVIPAGVKPFVTRLVSLFKAIDRQVADLELTQE